MPAARNLGDLVVFLREVWKIEPMRGLRVCVLLALPLAGAATSLAVTSSEVKANYQSIVDRNPFGLKPPVPPPTNNPAQTEAKPKSELYLTGITTVGYPRIPKKAYLMAKEVGAKDPKYYDLSEEQSKDGITILHIDEKERTVKIRSENGETLLSFKTHGITNSFTLAAAAPPPGKPGAPGAPNHPGAVPTVPGQVQPGQSTPVPLPAGNQQGVGQGNASQPNSRVIPSRSVRTRPADMGGGGTPAGSGAFNAGGGAPEAPAEDPALQYIRMKAEEARNRQMGIPTPPIPNLE